MLGLILSEFVLVTILIDRESDGGRNAYIGIYMVLITRYRYY